MKITKSDIETFTDKYFLTSYTDQVEFYKFLHDFIYKFQLNLSATDLGLINEDIATLIKSKLLDVDFSMKRIDERALYLKNYLSGKLYKDQPEPTQYNNVQFENAIYIKEIVDEFFNRRGNEDA